MATSDTHLRAKMQMGKENKTGIDEYAFTAFAQ
jgi:hypothetical protein